MTGVSCKQYGVTFHKNMDLKTMVQQWAKVSPVVRAQNPTLNVIMSTAEQALSVQETTIKTSAQAKDALNVVTEATILASAALTGNVTYSATQAADEAAKLAQEAENLTIEQLRQQVLGQLC